MNRASPPRRTHARMISGLQQRSNPNQVLRQRHRAVPLTDLTPFRRIEEVFAGEWNDVPALKQVWKSAEEKDLHNNPTMQKDMVEFLVEVIMRSGGMLPGHRHYETILASTTFSLTNNNIMSATFQGMARSHWGGYRNLKAACKASFEADRDEPGRLHHIPIEFVITAILVFKVLPLVRSPGGQMHHWVKKEIGLLTTALFNYDPNAKPSLYTCDQEVSAIPSGEPSPATGEESEASALAVIDSAETHFARSYNTAQASAEQRQLTSVRVRGETILAAMRAALQSPTWTCDARIRERILCRLRMNVSPMTALQRAAWKRRIDRRLNKLNITPATFWASFDPAEEWVNAAGEVVLSWRTTSVAFMNARDNLLRIIYSRERTHAERREAIELFSQQATTLVENLEVDQNAWRQERAGLIRNLNGRRRDRAAHLRQWLALIHPASQITKIFG